MMKILPNAILMLLIALTQEVAAQNAAPRQDPLLVRQEVEQFLRNQTTGLPGEVEIAVGPLDTRLNLPECAAPQPFLPNGGRAWGKTTVGVRCTAPTTWTIYVAATVRVFGDYIAAAAPLAQGQTIGPNDLARMRGDLSALPPGVVTDQSQALGRTASTSLALGAPLRQDLLRSQPAVQQGQTVRLVSSGTGFRISTEGRALTSAGAGQMIQARTPGGQMVSGVARLGGIVEVSY